MLKVIPCNNDVLMKVPNVLNYFYEVYKTNEFDVYSIADNTKLIGFIGIENELGVYLKVDDKIDMTAFMLDENKELLSIHREGYTIRFEEADVMAYINDKTGIEEYLSLNKQDEPDVDGYTGFISYMQYDPKRDINCELQYQQMYYENKDNFRPTIYEYHTKHIDQVYIDKNFNLSAPINIGPVFRDYYISYDLTDDIAAQNICDIKEFGLINYINRNYYVNKNDKYRYYKVKYIGLNGKFHTGYPYTKGFSTNEIEYLIKSYGFNTSIPNYVLNTYNNRNQYLKDIEYLLEQIKDIKEEDKEKYMKLQIRV